MLGSARAIVDQASSVQVRALLSRYATLYDAAASHPGVRSVAGRGTAFVIDVGMESWLVRHYRRGGALARGLGDRYARWSHGRAARELAISAAARERGIATPRVIAAIEYPAGLFKRFDLAVELVPDARDLAGVLFGDYAEDPDAAAEAAAQLIRSFIAHGLIHADLNLKNIIVHGSDAWVIDLDRCRLLERVSKSQRAAMKARFLRSLAKWERRTGETISDTARDTLMAAFDG